MVVISFAFVYVYTRVVHQTIIITRFTDKGFDNYIFVTIDINALMHGWVARL